MKPYLGEMIILEGDEIPIISRQPRDHIEKYYKKMNNGLYFLGFGKVRNPYVFGSVQALIIVGGFREIFYVDKKYIEDYYG